MNLGWKRSQDGFTSDVCDALLKVFLLYQTPHLLCRATDDRVEDDCSNCLADLKTACDPSIPNCPNDSGGVTPKSKIEFVDIYYCLLRIRLGQYDLTYGFLFISLRLQAKRGCRNPVRNRP